MLTNDVIYTFILICQICIGVMANSLLFIIYTYTFLTEPHLKKPIDSIFMHLTVVNISTIMIRSIPELMSSFGIKDLFDDIGCQTFLYVSRVIRGLSICTTFLLSVCQAITISPSHSKWARLKSKLSAWIFPSLLFFWVINMLIYTLILKTVKARLNFTVVGQGYVNAYCQSRKPIAHEARSFISIIVIHDVVFLALMIWSSLYLVWILYRHHRRAQHIQTSSLSSKMSPENKAIYTILLLVFCFVFFYLSNNCLTLYGYYASEKNSRLEGIGGILSSCYPTFCPFFLMKHNKIILKLTSILSNMRMTFCPRAFSG
ncbi:vomeronasal 1 receptor oryCunV1R1526 [Oryctolagus cuniculus]|uniref:Vomeronasal type-1 receptor n=1 Tax=Oryctolagus cuniculus TaxID=9986 RepID=A0A5F9CZA4_RABIT|nr:vomeronasal 1 receptor oryCunV1R1526 [Oryctolagus cuniculus]